MHDYAAAEIGADYRARFAERGAVEFAVADEHDFANGFENRFSGGAESFSSLGAGWDSSCARETSLRWRSGAL